MKRFIPWLLCIFCCSLFWQMNAQQAIPQQAQNGKPVKVDKAQFLKYIYNYEKNPQQWTYEGSVPCIIDFYADWCGPCRKLAPILEEIAKQYKGKVIVYKVDTESQRELATYFGIQSLPTMVFVPMNGTPQAAMGLMPKEDIEKIIEEVLKVSVTASKDI
ncbi:MAG: thioredoxin [Bacteroidales bacterium]